MKTYIKRLKSHPGVDLAVICTFAFILAGFANENMDWDDAIFVGLIASVFPWLIVVITARTQPIDSKYLDKKEK